MVACPPFMRVHACECVQACMQWHTMPPQPPGTLGHHNPWHALACWHPGIGTHSPAGTLALVPTRLLEPWHWYLLACWHPGTGTHSPAGDPPVPCRHPGTPWHPLACWGSTIFCPPVPCRHSGTLPTRLLGIHESPLHTLAPYPLACWGSISMASARLTPNSCGSNRSTSPRKEPKRAGAASADPGLDCRSRSHLGRSREQWAAHVCHVLVI